MPELKLPLKIKNNLEIFTRVLENIYAKELISIIVYGSAASGEFIDERSNVNLLVVLKDASLSALRKARKLVNNRQFKLIKPLFLNPEYINSSLDVFPIEFLDISENYFVLYGNDILKGLKIDIKNLRFQCEQELRAKLLGLKNIYLHNKDKYALKDLLFRAFTSLLHILRNLLRLKGGAPLYLKEEILKEVERVFSFDTRNFVKLLDAKKKNLKLSQNDIESMFLVFAQDLEKIVKIVDQL